MSHYLAEGIPHADQPLRRDVRMLGFELGRVLREHAGHELYQLVEDVRALAKARRGGEVGAEAKLRSLIAGASRDELERLVRALSTYFSLANLSEDRHRIRVLRRREAESHPEPRAESIGAAIDELSRNGASRERIHGWIAGLDVQLVFTAHPTEARRRTLTRAIRRVRQDLIDLDDGRLLPGERAKLTHRIATDLDVLWETDLLRPSKPTVLEEVKRSLFVVESLWDVVPRLCREVRRGLARVERREAEGEPAPPGADAPGDDEAQPADASRWLGFGSWIGGDRDGNPFVTAEVTRGTLIELRRAAVAKHLEQCDAMFDRLSISRRHHPVSAALAHAIDHAVEAWPRCAQRVRRLPETEPYRRWMRIIRHRLERTADADPFEPTPDAAYRSAAALRRDVEIARASLLENGHVNLARGELREWIDRIDVFGFHVAALDIREDSRALHAAVGELTASMGLTEGYAELDEPGRVALLTAPVDPERVLAITPEALGDATRQTWELFVLLEQAARRFGREALGMLIVSMTHRPSDALTMLWLGAAAAAWCGDRRHALLPVVPLFETIDDLGCAGETLAALIDAPAYRGHLEATGGVQVCMVGYSDSCKDGGYLASNWMLHAAQRRLAEVARARGVELTVFHGRGGSLGRGGGPAARGILSLPHESVAGRIRITEQGEVLAERYDDPEIARRHLEQVTWATLLVTAREEEVIDPAWVDLISAGAEAALAAYRGLREDPGFMAYFTHATPIDVIESLPIGSRPARRGGRRSLDDLRAIPYTFAWTQSRHLVTGFFGLGTGLEAAARAASEAAEGEARHCEAGWETLAAMYRRWPWFRAVIDNAELALAKADPAIARVYAELVPDAEAARRIGARFEAEHAAAVAAIRRVTGRQALLEAIPWLARSIRVRNPYVDPLNFIQVELTRRRHAEPDPDEADRLAEVLRLTVQGIALGLRTTG